MPPKVDGGLGLRRMETMNKAFIMKFAWGIIQDSRSVWVRVLNAKYMKHLDQVDQFHAKGFKFVEGNMQSVASGNARLELG